MHFDEFCSGMVNKNYRLEAIDSSELKAIFRVSRDYCDRGVFVLERRGEVGNTAFGASSSKFVACLSRK